MLQISGLETIVLKGGTSLVHLVPARGAIVTRFAAGGRELLYLDPATLEDPAKNVRGGIPVLFPSPGKLEADRFTRDGQSGAMKQHGFARDLPWEVDKTSTAMARLALGSNDRTRAQYPWDFEAALTFEVAAEGARLRLELRVENTGTLPMPFAFGIHPYFLVADKAHAHIATVATRAFDNVTKRQVPFRGFDLTLPEVDLHLLDHGSTESGLTWADGSVVTIRGSAEMTRWVVWTLGGKDFVCLEPWSAPGNALNSGEGLLTIAPGAARELWIELEHAAH